MLVVDLHTLETINRLDLVHDILLGLYRAEYTENVGRGDAAVGQPGTGLDVVVLLNQDLLGQRNQIVLFSTALVLDGDLTVTAFDLAHDNLAVDLGDDGGVGRVAGLEQLGNARQTARNIAGLTDGTRNLDEHVAHAHHVAVVGHDVCTHRQVVLLEGNAVGIDDVDGRALGLVSGLDDHLVAVHGILVRHFLAEGYAVDHVLETDLTGGFDDGGGVVRIPFADHVALLHGLAVLLVQDGAVGNIIVRVGNTRVHIDQAHLGHSAHDDVLRTVFGLALDGTELFEDQFAVVLGLDGGIGRGAGSGTTDVEGTQGQLGTRFTDGLCGDNAHHFALLDHPAGSQVAAVALRADTLAGFAREDGTDFDLLDREAVDEGGNVLFDFLAGRDDQFARERVDDIVDGSTAQDALAEGFDDLVLVLDGRGDEAAEGTAILFGNDHIVRHIHQTTGQVTGIRRLQGGIGQTLTGTVRGDEVLKHRHTLLQVGDNRVLDNFSSAATGLLRLGH